MMAFSEKNLKVLISEEMIAKRVKALGAEIAKSFQGKELVAIGVLKGSFVFFADLIRAIDSNTMTIEFLGVSSYGNEKTSSGEVKITQDVTHPLQGKHVLLVEDIIDSGLTMSYLQKNLLARGPLSLTTATFLFKPEALKTKVQIDHVGFEIGNDFVVGYGLDYAGKFRNLPYLAKHIE